VGRLPPPSAADAAMPGARMWSLLPISPGQAKCAKVNEVSLASLPYEPMIRLTRGRKLPATILFQTKVCEVIAGRTG
jgi:hypothetical protein